MLVVLLLLGDRFLSSAGNCARPLRLPDPSPVLDKNRAPMGPESLSSTGAGIWRKAPMAFSDSSSVLDKFQSASYVVVVVVVVVATTTKKKYNKKATPLVL